MSVFSPHLKIKVPSWIKQDSHIMTSINSKSWKKNTSGGKESLLNQIKQTLNQQSRELHNDKGFHSTRLNYHKYICTQHCSTQIHKTSTSRPMGKLCHPIVRDFNTPLAVLDRSSQKTNKSWTYI